MSEEKNKKTYFSSLRAGLKKTTSFLKEGFSGVFLNDRKKLNDEEVENIERVLIESDLGVNFTMALIEKVGKKSWQGVDDVISFIKNELKNEFVDQNREIISTSNKPNIILFVGINGAGKTTSISKIATSLLSEGKSVLFAASDTFRAAAIEQLTIWAERLDVPIVKHKMGADPAAVAYDAIERAKAKQIDYVLIDTAGRLHNQTHLMEELKKIVRVIKSKVDEDSIESLVVLDGNAGHNSFQQAKKFKDAIGVDGVIITKLDGTAKGGVVVSVEKELSIPVKFIGVGEKQTDLLPFNPDSFVEALLSIE